MLLILIIRRLIVANWRVILYERYQRSKLDMNFLKVFDCLEFIHVPKMCKNKLKSKSKKCLLIGFDKYTKAYHLFYSSTYKIIMSQDVVYDKLKIGYKYVTKKTEVIEHVTPLSKKTIDHTKNLNH